MREWRTPRSPSSPARPIPGTSVAHDRYVMYSLPSAMGDLPLRRARTTCPRWAQASPGVLFTAADHEGTEPVAIVTETMTQVLWPRGKRLLGTVYLFGKAEKRPPCARFVGMCRMCFVPAHAAQAADPYDIQSWHCCRAHANYILIIPVTEHLGALSVPLRSTIRRLLSVGGDPYLRKSTQHAAEMV